MKFTFGKSDEMKNNKNTYFEQKKADRAEYEAHVVQGLEIIKEKGNKALIDLIYYMPNLSTRNILAIISQRPQSKFLRSFQQIKEENIKINKGEKGVMLLVPASQYRKKDNTIGTNFATQKYFDSSQLTGVLPFKDNPRKVDEKELLSAILDFVPFDIALDENQTEVEVWNEDKTVLSLGSNYFDESLQVLIVRTFEQSFKQNDIDEPESLAVLAKDIFCRKYNIKPIDVVPCKNLFEEITLQDACEKIDAARSINEQYEKEIEANRQKNTKEKNNKAKEDLDIGER